MKLALGTVQFGMDYGVANTGGQVASAEIVRILDVARAGGIDTIDTAAGYGESEARLGEAGVASFKLISKLPPLPDEVENVARWAEGVVRHSIGLMRVDRLYGLLLHRADDLRGPRGNEVYSAIRDLKEKGLVQKIGLSIYGPDILETALNGRPIDLLQAPFNLLDRRIETTGWLDRLKGLGVEIHTRSAFLQGLLLMRAEDRPPKFARWGNLWRIIEEWQQNTGLTPLEACIGFAARNARIDRVVVGVDAATQLEQILAAVGKDPGPVPAGLRSEPELIDPAQWHQL